MRLFLPLPFRSGSLSANANSNGTVNAGGGNDDDDKNQGLDKALRKECVKELTDFIQIEWGDLVCFVGIAWVFYSVCVWLLGLNLGTVVLDYDLGVECGSGIVLIWSLLLLFLAKKRIDLLDSSLMLQMCQFCSLLAALGFVYVISRAGSVITIDSTMHANMESSTYTFDKGGLFSYSTVVP